MHLLYLQHDPLDGPGTLLDWAKSRGHRVSRCLICEGEPLPPIDSFDLLVSLGGPMGAYEVEKHPWLEMEKQYLRDAFASGKKILGLCLGTQLIAVALGGRAFRHRCKEFGWQPIEPTPEGLKWFPSATAGKCASSTEGHEKNQFLALETHEKNQFLALETHEKNQFLAFQWHGDTYTLPQGAVQLARNAACEQQAFAIGNQVLGLQFHLEWTEAMMREALAEPGVAPPPSPSVQTPDEIMGDPSLFESGQQRFFDLVDRLVAQ